MILENSGKCCIHQRDNWHESIQHDRRTSGRFVVVHVDALQLEVGVTAVGTGGVDTVLIADNLSSEGEEGVRGRRDGDGKNRPDGTGKTSPGEEMIDSRMAVQSEIKEKSTHLPEFGTNLVATLSALDVHNLASRG